MNELLNKIAKEINVKFNSLEGSGLNPDLSDKNKKDLPKQKDPQPKHSNLSLSKRMGELSFFKKAHT